MFAASIQADRFEPASLIAIYERTNNFMLNEKAMGNSPVAIRSVMLYALVEMMREAHKDDEPRLLKEAKQAGIYQTFKKPEEITVMMEAVNLLTQIVCDYIPPDQTKEILRSIYDLTRDLNSTIEATNREIGPLGWRMQPVAGKLIEEHKAKQP